METTALNSTTPKVITSVSPQTSPRPRSKRGFEDSRDRADGKLTLPSHERLSHMIKGAKHATPSDVPSYEESARAQLVVTTPDFQQFARATDISSDEMKHQSIIAEKEMGVLRFYQDREARKKNKSVSSYKPELGVDTNSSDMRLLKEDVMKLKRIEMIKSKMSTSKYDAVGGIFNIHGDRKSIYKKNQMLSSAARAAIYSGAESNMDSHLIKVTDFMAQDDSVFGRSSRINAAAEIEASKIRLTDQLNNAFDKTNALLDSNFSSLQGSKHGSQLKIRTMGNVSAHGRQAGSFFEAKTGSHLDRSMHFLTSRVFKGSEPDSLHSSKMSHQQVLGPYQTQRLKRKHNNRKDRRN